MIQRHCIYVLCHSSAMAKQEAPAPLKSLNSYDPTYITFINKSSRNAEAWWLNFEGKPVSYGAIKPRSSLQMKTFLSKYCRTSTLTQVPSPACNVTKVSIFQLIRGSSEHLTELNCWLTSVKFTFQLLCSMGRTDTRGTSLSMWLHQVR